MTQRYIARRLALLGAVLAFTIACGDDSHRGPGEGPGPGEGQPTGPSEPRFDDPAYPEVWSSNAFDGQSYEFKSNCVGEFEELETCFLWTVTALIVEAPDGTRFELNKDFNINDYSGEVTRRWVLYGPVGAGLMPAGDYRFHYYEGEQIVLTQTVDYTPKTIGFPEDIKWIREGDDLVIEWTPPEGTDSEMWYKVLLFPDGGNVISDVIDWDASSARLPDIPLEDGATGTLNVAIYFRGGYAPSQYLPFTW